ncbi:MAG: AMP-binding protein [Bacteroidales bacterium]
MDRELPYKTISEIQEVQSQLLSSQMEYVMKYSPFYREHLAGLNAESIHSIEDLTSLPVTTKEHLQQRNMDFLCVEHEKIIDYMTTSGTTGSPITFVATERDLQRLADNEYASFICADGSSRDIYQLMLTLDRRFMAGMAYFLGLRKLGAGIIRVGPGNLLLQFDTIQRTSPTVLVTVPSFLLKLIDYAREQKIDLSATSVKSVVCIGEPIRDSNFRLNKLGRRIIKNWDIKLYSTYASTEMGAAFTECHAGAGGHLNPEMIVVEFLDQENNPVGQGELGEVTITSLAVEGMPLVRFKTGDICHHFTQRCSCGRSTLRVGPIEGRKNQMIKYKGTTLYPPAFYEILNEIEEVENYIVVVSTNSIDTDDILVIIGSGTPTPSVEKRIKDHFRARLRVAPSIQFMNPKEVTRMQNPNLSRKPVTFMDRRKT